MIVVYYLWEQICETFCHLSPEFRVMSESVFRDTWLKLLPYIVTAKPMSDLCWTCQANNSLIYRSANTPEAEKSDRPLQEELHLRTVQEERTLYTAMVAEAKATCQSHQLSDFVHSAPCSRQVKKLYFEWWSHSGYKACCSFLKSLESSGVIVCSTEQQSIAVVQTRSYHGVYHMSRCRLR